MTKMHAFAFNFVIRTATEPRLRQGRSQSLDEVSKRRRGNRACPRPRRQKRAVTKGADCISLPGDGLTRIHRKA